MIEGKLELRVAIGSGERWAYTLGESVAGYALELRRFAVGSLRCTDSETVNIERQRAINFLEVGWGILELMERSERDGDPDLDGVSYFLRVGFGEGVERFGDGYTGTVRGDTMKMLEENLRAAVLRRQPALAGVLAI